MTVKQLIEILEKKEPGVKVVLNDGLMADVSSPSGAKVIRVYPVGQDSFMLDVGEAAGEGETFEVVLIG